jgi:gliding motility-associated-like protein
VKKNCTIILFLIFSFSVLSQNSLIVLLQKTDAFCFTGAASVNILDGTPPYTITWSNGSTGTSVNGLASGTYSVKVADSNSKDTTLNFTINFLACEVVIGNHFTPNDDGFNDTWSITNLKDYPNFEITVYNRWGQTVFQQSQQYTAWDGKSHGITMPDATYYYIFYFDKSDKSKYLKGDVSILR